jgi:hypothetical protein
MKPDLTPGDNILAFHRDIWKPGVLIKLGRKWAMVQFHGRARKAKVPATAVRPIAATPQPASPTPPVVGAQARVAAESIGLEICDPYLRLKIDGTIVTAIPTAHREYADEIVAALRACRRSRDNNGQNS